MDQRVVPYVEQIGIARRNGLSSECIYTDHLNGRGLPVIVNDAIDDWPALSAWSFDFFRHRYGSETVAPGIDLDARFSRRIMKLAHFIDYVEAPSQGPRGFWLDLETKLPRAQCPGDTAAPLYLYDHTSFLRHPELLADIKPDPQCIEDWLSLLPESVQDLLQATRYHQRGLLIGPEQSVTHLHFDFLDSHGYLAQIVGSKLCILFPPEDSDVLYGGTVDPENPDLENFPLFERAKAFVCVLSPGELLLIPSRWWHYVRNLEKSIAVVYNFFNRANFGEYVASMLKALPKILEDFEHIPGWQHKLGGNWSAKGFDYPAGTRR